MIKNKSLLIFLAIMFLAVGLRLFPFKDLTRGSIGKVDAFILNDSLRPLSVIADSLPIDQGPLKYYLLHLFLYLGRDEFIILAIPFIFGIASIPLLYYIGVLLFDKKTALLSCFFLSISCWHINHSLMVRSYTLYSFLVLLQVVFFLRIIKYNYFRDCLFYVLACYLAFYSFYTTIFIVFAEIIWIIFFYKKKIWFSPLEKIAGFSPSPLPYKTVSVLKLATTWAFRRLSPLMGVSNSKKIIFSLCCFFVLISPSVFRVYNMYVYKVDPINVIDNTQSMIKVSWIINSFGGVKNFFPIGILVFLLSFFLLLYQKNKNKETVFIFIIFFIPIFIYSCCLIFYKMRLVERYFLFVYPFFLLISAAGIMSFRKNFIKIVLSFVFILPLILFLSNNIGFNTKRYIPHDYKKRYKDYVLIASMIEKKYNEVDYVFVAPWTTIYPIQYYLDKSNKNPVKIKLYPHTKKSFFVYENDFIELYGIRDEKHELFLLKELLDRGKIMVIDIKFGKKFYLSKASVEWLNEHSFKVSNSKEMNLYFLDKQ
ncbi:MAG: glycosyltransferase family 39 protein [Candidatus Omnitrophica bacterium]|nr:glycosyltransferase family 39 protein [Candidatus Omnitrophota bacterium]